MNIHIEWDEQQKNTLVFTFRNDWTWHDCREVMQIAVFMQDNEKGIHHLYDLRDSRLSSRSALSQLKRLLQIGLHPAPEQIVIVDRPHRLHMEETMLSSVANVRGNLHFAASLQEARERLM